MEWIDVNERLPERMLESNYSWHVLCCNNNTRFVAYYIFEPDQDDKTNWILAHGYSDALHNGNALIEYMKVSHWMPLPERPKIK